MPAGSARRAVSSLVLCGTDGAFNDSALWIRCEKKLILPADWLYCLHIKEAL